MVDVRRLRVLCEVARHGSFSAAGISLGYTQPAISRQVALLESELGTVLVRRLPQGAALTDAGRVLVARGEAILAQLDALEVEVGALAGLEGGRLRFAAFSSACASIVPRVIACYRERYPAVELAVTMSDPIDSLRRLRSGEFDLALINDASDAFAPHGATVAVLDPQGPAGVDLVHLFDEPMYLAMPREHPRADAPRLSLDDFAGEPWLSALPGACPDAKLLARACHAAGFEPRIAFQNDDYSVLLGFVAAGVGVALIPDMAARRVRDDVVVRALVPPPPSRSIIAAFPPGYRSPAAAAMLSVLSEVGEAWLADRPEPTVAAEPEILRA
jgi:DNA-binding transcriptional LysR family regulator